MTPRLTLPAAALVLLAACDASARVTATFEQTYPFQSGRVLTLESLNGSIEIQGWDQDKIEVRATRHARDQRTLDLVKIDVQASASSIAIRTLHPSDTDGLGASYVVHVPKRVKLERIWTSNGPVTIRNIEGPVEVRTSNGGVRLSEIDGHANIRSSNGGIRADVKGRLTATTSNGPIEAEVAEAEPSSELRLTTSNAGISLKLPARVPAVQAKTSNGGITVRMPASAAAKLSARTSNGGIQSDFPVTGGVHGRTRIDGAIGSGGPLLDLTTSNGGINLRQL